MAEAAIDVRFQYYSSQHLCHSDDRNCNANSLKNLFMGITYIYKLASFSCVFRKNNNELMYSRSSVYLYC